MNDTPADTDQSTVRPLYMWPFQAEEPSRIEIGPCELAHLTAFTEAIVFAEKIVLDTGVFTETTIDGLGEDLVHGGDAAFREARRRANLSSDDALGQWDIRTRISRNAAPVERVKGILALFNRGERFIEAAGRDARKFYRFFFSTGFDFCPDPEMTVPFLAGVQSVRPQRILIETVDAALRERLEIIGPLLQSRPIYVPSLTAILLNRCKNRSDIPDTFIQLRRDFREARETLANHRQSLAKASHLGEQLDAIRDLERATGIVSKRIVDSEGGVITRSTIRHAWDVMREADLAKLLTEPVDLLWEYLEKTEARRLAIHFVDIYRQLREIPD